MGLFGIYAHGITETWVMEKALIGLVACESERHTAENIATWTKEALVDIARPFGQGAPRSSSRPIVVSTHILLWLACMVSLTLGVIAD